jgi:curved DNA-binding protein CbpA
MSQSSLPPDWLDKFSDPYAVLGIAVTADDRRVLKRYRNVAKLLHPDSFTSNDQAARDLASQIFARLVNPAYQKLKQEKNRTESSAMLRFQVRRLNREGTFMPKSDVAHQLLKHPVSEVDVFYEQAIADLAETQFQPLQGFEATTLKMGELNLVYFQLKMGEVFVREKRTGLVAAAEAKPIQFTPASDEEVATESYARRHFRRAQEYMKKANWAQAIQELRDAIKIESNQSDYHALLGIAYAHQNLSGMATVYLRQALKLDPHHKLALKYAIKLGIEVSVANGQTNGNGKKPDVKSRGLFDRFRSRK